MLDRGNDMRTFNVMGLRQRTYVVELELELELGLERLERFDTPTSHSSYHHNNIDIRIRNSIFIQDTLN